MPAIQIKDVPGSIYTQIRRQAQKHHRSVSGEVLNILETSLTADDQRPEAVYADIISFREQMRQKHGTAPSSVALIREDRER
jgi:plasmid stability protein